MVTRMWCPCFTQAHVGFVPSLGVVDFAIEEVGLSMPFGCRKGGAGVSLAGVCEGFGDIS